MYSGFHQGARPSCSLSSSFLRLMRIGGLGPNTVNLSVNLARGTSTRRCVDGGLAPSRPLRSLGRLLPNAPLSSQYWALRRPWKPIDCSLYLARHTCTVPSSELDAMRVPIWRPYDCTHSVSVFSVSEDVAPIAGIPDLHGFVVRARCNAHNIQ